jgi:diguanylate cyclase (GGDEF)-like protein
VRDWWCATALVVLTFFGCTLECGPMFFTFFFPAILIGIFTLCAFFFSKRAMGIVLLAASVIVPSILAVADVDIRYAVPEYALILCLCVVMEYLKKASVREMSVFLEYINRVGAADTFEDASEPAVKLIREYIPDAFPAVALYDPEKESFRVISSVGYVRFANGAFPRNNSISWRAYRTGEAQVVDNVLADPGYVEGIPGARSEMSVPIFWKGSRFGVLNVESTTLARFRPEDVRNVSFLAAILGEVFSHIEASRALGRNIESLETTNRELSETQTALRESLDAVRRGKQEAETLNRRLRDLFSIIAMLSASRNSGEMFRNLTEALAKRFSYRNIYVHARLTRTGPIETQSSHGVTLPEEMRRGLIRDGKGTTGRVIETGVPYRLSDVSKDPYYVCHDPAVRSELVLPIRSQTTTWGVLAADSEVEDGISSQDEELLSIIVAHLALELESKDVLRDLNEEVSRLKVLHEIMKVISMERRDERMLLKTLVNSVAEKFGYEEITAYLVEEPGLTAVASNVYDDAHLETLTEWLRNADGGLVSLQMRNSGVSVFENVETHPKYTRGDAWFSPVAQLDAPIRYNERCFGVLSVESSQRFSRGDVDFFTILSGHLGAIMALHELIRSNERMALEDELTHLWNRRYLFGVLERQQGSVERRGGRFAVVMIDMADFKTVNDRLGHIVGDAVLRQFSECLRSAARSSDIVGRYGGDEFLVILPGAGADEARGFIGRIRRSLEKIHPIGMGGLPLLADFGFTVLPDEVSTIQEALRIADERMYEQKEERKKRKAAEL